MNLVVRPDGTAELDDRPAAVVARAVLGAVWITANLVVDQRTVGRVLTLPWYEEDVNEIARLLVTELTNGVHVDLHGPVVLADLDGGTAHLLLEVVRRH